MISVQLRTDRPMPEIARACVDALLEGRDVDIPAAVWRRPGLTKAIAAEQQSRGLGRGVWRFTADHTDTESGPLPDAGDILGWGAQRAPAPDSRRARSAAATAAPAPLYTMPVTVPAPVPVPVGPSMPHAPVPVMAPTMQRPVHVNHQAVHAPVVPAPPPVVQFGQALPQTSAMMQAVYALVAFTQPVMAGGLKPGPTRQRTFGAPDQTRPRWTAAQAMAELADLDGL